MQKGFQSKIKNRIPNSVDPDDMAQYERSYQDLKCLHRYLFWSTGLKRLIGRKCLRHLMTVDPLVNQKWSKLPGLMPKMTSHYTMMYCQGYKMILHCLSPSLEGSVCQFH